MPLHYMRQGAIAMNREPSPIDLAGVKRAWCPIVHVCSATGVAERDCHSVHGVRMVDALCVGEPLSKECEKGVVKE